MTGSRVRDAVVVAFASIAIATTLAVPASAQSAQTFAQPATQGSGWKGAFSDSFRLLLIEHTIRIGFQDKTRRELGGPFFRDYVQSLRIPHTWEDGDRWSVNYVGHPIHGAAASRIWIDHVYGERDVPFSLSTTYWTRRGIAAAWAAGYSVQFEFGPLSEASIGNVGRDPRTTGWVDHVVTPAGAFAMTVAEDALDRYLIAVTERHTQNRVYRAAMRILFNPSRSFANVTEGRAPWFRYTRPLDR